LRDVIEGLFHIAVADGQFQPSEDAFLQRVSDIFGIPQQEYHAIRARFVPDAAPDPYAVLGADPAMSVEEIRNLWRRLVRETHPDSMIARGVPEEAIKLAEKRMKDINRAWEIISEAT